MPKKEIDYSKCVIYKIQQNDKDDLLYVGHTTNFTKRKSNHKENVLNENGVKYNQKLYKLIRENGNWECFRMVIVKEFPCGNKRQAEAEEDKVMRELKASMNTIYSFHTKEDRILSKHREYEKHKERYQLSTKKYYEENKQLILEHNKQYREEHKQQIKAQKATKYMCKCGKEYTNCHKLRHEKTQFHQTFLNENEPVVLVE